MARVLPEDFLSGPMSLVTNTKGEFGAYTQLFFDNLSTMVGVLGAIMGNFSGDFGVPNDILQNLVFAKMASGLGLALVWGNVYYSYQAARMTRTTGRQYTAQPYGINTVAAFAFVFTIMIPVFVSEWSASGFSEDPDVKRKAFQTAYNVAVAGNFVVGILNIVFGMIGPVIMQAVPPAALLVPIAGIGFSFLGVGQITACLGQPIVGFLPLLFVFIGWFAHIKIGGVVPEALTVILLGTVLGWIDPITRGVGGVDGYGLIRKTELAAETLSNFRPDPESFAEVGAGFEILANYMGIIIPVAITATAFTLMCLLSARNAGDPYPIRETMLIDGVGTIIASCFGSPFGTVVYIGHPVHKRTGATTGYSWLNGFTYLIIGMSGLFAIFEAIFPVQAVGPVILLVGLMICEDAVKNLPQRHWCIFFFGLFPSVCDWLTNAVPVAPLSSSDAQWGVFAFKRGAVLISFLWSAFLTYIIDKVWWKAAVWSALAGFFSLFGVMHQQESGVSKINGGTLGPFAPGRGDQGCTYGDEVEGGWPNNPLMCGTIQWRFAVAYWMITAVCLIAEAAQRMGFGPEPVDTSCDNMNFQVDWNDVSHLARSDVLRIPAGRHVDTYKDDPTAEKLPPQDPSVTSRGALATPYP
eukprot:CAMPEP_0173438638 /NCGR_PEP_ID=MMETSP1357-20121228/20522_1 /TAXON_ID=77926 /ORGANISM="Hemiselmis rufescens, Strain PCC563" /LENGTH=636 /DNA_ID=CAMNT_0014403947 /DNA_START=20 /DNA_END=1927 /DNA_ORIENTATION=-